MMMVRLCNLHDASSKDGQCTILVFHGQGEVFEIGAVNIAGSACQRERSGQAIGGGLDVIGTVAWTRVE